MITFENISKSYKNTTVLKNISFTIKDGEFVCLIGESGCGKTTTLKMINQLIEPTSGKITINNQDIKKIDEIKLRRKMGYVIQQTGLFSHMSIRDNIEIIAKIEKVPEKNRKERVKEMMRMVDLDESLLDRYPNELSGGQLQRIGIARAFMIDPKIILMDEPFSALDPMSRTALQDELLKLQRKFHKTIVFVTHDMDEAIKLADKIAIMEKGHLVQYDTPENILKHPANDFVKHFVGNKRIWNSPEYIKVRDIMITHPITCKEEDSKFYCINKMRMMKVDSLMVVDDSKRLIGILYAESLTLKHYKGKSIKDMIEKDFVSVKENDSIIDLANLIKTTKRATIPVIDKKNCLTGLITRSSLITAMSQQFVEEDKNETN